MTFLRTVLCAFGVIVGAFVLAFLIFLIVPAIAANL